MKVRIRLLVMAAALAMVTVPALQAPVYAANADPLDIDPDLAAKVAREKLKQRQGKDAAGKKKGDCGKIDIGNTDNSKSASQRVAPKEKTVIITGPVINATKC